MLRFDVCSVNEHTSQQLPQEWWSTTFREAICEMGHTGMVLSPWDKPVPLTRAWCLWEMYCTVDTGARFSVCLSTAQRAAFEVAIAENWQAAQDAFAHIRVQDAEAGSEDDKTMIFAAVEACEGGFNRMDTLALGCMREWFQQTVRMMHSDQAHSTVFVVVHCTVEPGFCMVCGIYW